VNFGGTLIFGAKSFISWKIRFVASEPERVFGIF
jgi:hypothetical protein